MCISGIKGTPCHSSSNCQGWDKACSGGKSLKPYRVCPWVTDWGRVTLRQSSGREPSRTGRGRWSGCLPGAHALAGTVQARTAIRLRGGIGSLSLCQQCWPFTRPAHTSVHHCTFIRVSALRQRRRSPWRCTAPRRMCRLAHAVQPTPTLSFYAETVEGRPTQSAVKTGAKLGALTMAPAKLSQRF